MKTSHLLTTLSILSFTLLPACADEHKTEKVETKAEWTDLLAGEDLNTLWKAASRKEGDKPREVGQRWQLKDGVLTLDKNREGRGGSIDTKETYLDFELKFDFNIQENCNSGIKYRLKHSTGFEFQIIDDVNYRDNKVTHRTAEIYELKEEETPRKLNPAGQWNTARIVAKGNTITHYLNGQKVLTIEYGSEDWKKRFEKSKYFKKGTLDFGTHTGPIHLQDHSDTIIAFKNMHIRKL